MAVPRVVMFGVEAPDTYKDRPFYFYSGPLLGRPYGEDQEERLTFDPRARHISEAWISTLSGGAISRFAQVAK